MMNATGTFSVMSFNIWCDGEAGGQPLEQTAKVIAQAGVDLVGVQESGARVAELTALLGWKHVYEQRAMGGAILSQHEIARASPSGVGAQLRLAEGRTAWLFNIHLAPSPYQPYQLLGIPYKDSPPLASEAEAITAAEASRGAQLREWLVEIAAAAASDEPVFVTGDFNEPSHLDWTQAAANAGLHPCAVAYPASRAMAGAGFVDAYRARYADELAKPGHTWTPTTSPDDAKDHHDRIDFVYYKPAGATVNDVQIVGESPAHADIVVSPYPSDHRAVVARFTLLSISQ